MTKQETIAQEIATPAHKSIAAALAAAQAEMGRAKKSAANPHFKSKYADLDAVCDAAMPALNRHGIAVVQPLERIGEEWVVVTRFIHGETGETMEGPVPLIIGKNDMQGLGSAITYARRYGLMGLAGIAPEDDDGNAAAKNPPQAPSSEAIENAASSLANADSLDRLKAIWLGLTKPVQADATVILAKDNRKAALEATPKPAADLGDDTIPYGGPNA